MLKKSRNSSTKPSSYIVVSGDRKAVSEKREQLKDQIRYAKGMVSGLQEYEFEGKKLMGTRDYDTILKYIYNDYMKLPPEDKRDPHAPVSSYFFG